MNRLSLLESLSELIRQLPSQIASWNVPSWLASDSGQHLAWALLHTLWQAPAIVLLLYLLLRQIPADRATLRYGLSLLALAGVLAAGLTTFSVLDLDDESPPATAATDTEFTEQRDRSERPARYCPQRPADK